MFAHLEGRWPPALSVVLTQDWAALDPKAPAFFQALLQSPAPHIWHKRSTFFHHLKGVWTILSLWGQSHALCRAGLFHSSYSNHFVSFALFQNRFQLKRLIGPEAEELVHLFCLLDRKAFEDRILKALESHPRNPLGQVCQPKAPTFPCSQGYYAQKMGPSTGIVLNVTQAAQLCLLTAADYLDQMSSWQEAVQVRHKDITHHSAQVLSQVCQPQTAGVWPGPGAPYGVLLHMVLKLAYCAVASATLPTPPYFEVFQNAQGRDLIPTPFQELEARNAYESFLQGDFRGPVASGPEEPLKRCSRLNPWVGEPYVLGAQLALQNETNPHRFQMALGLANTGLGLLGAMGTSWDKRVPYDSWIAWARTLIYQAQKQQWPNTSNGFWALGWAQPQ